MQTLDILSDYIDRDTLARSLNCSPRTLARYENQADGLPSLIVAGRKHYRRQAVLNWLAKRETRPNARRA
jgi:hypothetical protein